MIKTFISFFINRLQSFHPALKGCIHLFKTENAIKVHLFHTLILLVLGFLFQINTQEWMFQMLTMGALFGLEAINTAIEKLCDFIEPHYHLKIKIIKDISAGAVLITSFFGLIIMGMIYIPKILNLLS